MKKKLCSIILLLMLVVSLCPADIFANEGGDVSVIVTPPAIGANPDFSPVVTIEADYITGYEVHWGIIDTDIYLTPEYTFKANIGYALSIALYSDQWPSEHEVEGEINGESANTWYNEGVWYLIRFFPELRPLEIIKTDITITAPSIGAAADYNPVLPVGSNFLLDTSRNTGYFRNGVMWHDITEEYEMLPAAAAFAEDHAYGVRIYLVAKNEYLFANGVVATVNGQPAEVHVGEGNGWISVDYSFSPLIRKGWQLIDGNYYYYIDGAPVTGWQLIDGKYYYFADSGVLRTGFVNYGGKYYYFSKITGNLQTGFVRDGGNYYYFSREDGTMQFGFVLEGGKYYYFSKVDGTMQFCFVLEGGKYYYFSKVDGTMQLGFVLDSGKYYYFSKTDGSMQFGFVKDGGKYYYFSPADGSMQFGWVQYAGYWFYFSPINGAMVTGTQVIGGRTYQFNAYGVCIG